jgi:nitric oxide dioxygenase
MAVSEADIRVIRESLPLIRRHLDTAADAFYLNLFTLAPELEEMFHGDVSRQGMRFMSTLVTMANLLDHPAAFAAGVERLTVSHVRFGVRAEHFAPMGFALLITLGESMGRDFTEEIQHAWRAAYDQIAEEMIARGNFP